MNLYFLSATFLFSAVAIALLAKSPLRLYFGDAPDHRKVHQYVVPRLGGLGIIAAFLVFLYAQRFLLGAPGLRLPEPLFLSLIFLSVFLLAAGTWDDVKALGYKTKFVLQFALAGALVYGFGNGFESFKVGGFHWDLGALGPLLSVVWMVAVMNAFNIIDGIDGLAGTVALCTLSALAVLANGQGDTALTAVCMALGGGVGGFLLFNFSRRHKVFLGDTGSQFLGAVLGLLVIRAALGERSGASVLTPLLLIGYPLFDVATAMLRRFLRCGKGSARARLRGMFLADNEHLHHRMVYWGMSHLQSTFLLGLVAGSVAAAGVVIARIEGALQWGVALYLGVALFLILNRLGYVGLRPWLTFPRIKPLPSKIVGVIEPDDLFMHSLQSFKQDQFEFLAMPQNITRFFGSELLAVLLYNASSSRFEAEWAQVLRASEFQDCPAVVIASPSEIERVKAQKPAGFESVIFVEKPVRIPELLRVLEQLAERQERKGMKRREKQGEEAFSLAELALRNAREA